MKDKSADYSPDFWITKEDEIPSSIYLHHYAKDENEAYIVWHSGILAYYDKRQFNWLDIADLAFHDKLSFGDILGWYKIVCYKKSDKSWLFFGDSSGSQCFFMNADQALFSDHLLSLWNKNLTPEINLNALLSIFCKNGMEAEETLLLGITKTDPEAYYLFQNGCFERRSKMLSLFSDEQKALNVTDVLDPVLTQIKRDGTLGRVCAVCTGGTDSRTILAGLSALSINPQLVITGHHDNPDLTIAHQIAKELERSLTVIDPSIVEQDWLEKGFWMTDGLYDVVLSYRHYLKAKWSTDNGILYEFGGVGGEFYKNVYYNPFHSFYLRKNEELFLKRTLFFPASSVKTWCGKKMLAAAQTRENRIHHTIEAGRTEKKILLKCNRIGFYILSSSTCRITSGYSSACCKIDPLMDRRLIASASHENAFCHLLHMWQRRQIAKTCLSLSDISTDQGYSCSTRIIPLIKDAYKKLLFVTDRVFNRIRRLLGFGFKSVEQRYWDNDYIEARKTELWRKTIDYCKKKEIIRPDIDENEIPLSVTGNLLLVGMLVFGSCEKTNNKETFHEN